MKHILILLTLLIFSGSAYALNADEYIELYETVDDEEKFVLEAVIMGMGEGIIGASDFSGKLYGKKLFCPPQGIYLNNDNYYQIMKSAYTNAPDLYKDVQLEIVLLFGLVATFPCED